MVYKNHSSFFKFIAHLFFIFLILLQIPDEHIIRFFSIKKGRIFLDFCLKDKLKSQISPIIDNSPLISIIIPVYNCGIQIKNTIRSIQNQNIQNLEIILVNDFSHDNSYNILRELGSEDNRIKIINNKKNKGTLYSRSIGVLSSKGKYIFQIDNEDMFFDHNILRIVYNEALKSKIEIIGFKAVRGNSYFSQDIEMYDDPFHMHQNNLIVKQPELRFFSIYHSDCHIWGKCIFNMLYKKAINILGKERYDKKICYAEDDIIIFVLFQISNSYKFISKYGIFHLMSPRSASQTLSRSYIIFCQLYYIKIIYELSESSLEGIQATVYQLSNSLKSKIFCKSLKHKNIRFLNSIMNNILNNTFLPNITNQNLRKNYTNCIFFKKKK